MQLDTPMFAPEQGDERRGSKLINRSMMQRVQDSHWNNKLSTPSISSIVQDIKSRTSEQDPPQGLFYMYRQEQPRTITTPRMSYLLQKA